MPGMATEEISLRQRGGTPAMDPPQEHRKPPEQGFRQFLWNSTTKQFLGRTSSSWAKILFFYVVFYAAIAALWFACWCVFYRQIDMKVPYRKLGDSIIKPGLNHLPDGQISDTISQLDDFLEPYMQRNHDNSLQLCTYDNHEALNRTTSSCSQDVTSFGPCSPGHDDAYGYKNKTGSLCVFLKLNKIYGWKPQFYDDPNQLPSSMPDDLKNHIKNRDQKALRTVWVSCEGKGLSDVTYIPHRGFPEFYFPFVNTKGYLSPVVAVYFENLTKGEPVSVKCRAWAKGFPRVHDDHISETRFILNAEDE